jgi:GNAT superfamily N-acetyltransferase
VSQAGELMSQLEIREAIPSDIPTILMLLREFAEYEKRLDRVQIDASALEQHLFREPVRAYVLLACVEGVPVCYAMYFPVFASFSGRPWLFLEDLYVQPSARGSGVGLAMMSHLARLTTAQGWAGIAWDVLEWNEPALRFYDRLGAVRGERKIPMEISGEALERIARARDGRVSHFLPDQPMPSSR